MRVYILGSVAVWCVLFSVWYLLSLRPDSNALNETLPGAVASKVMSPSQCSIEVAALFAMSAKLLQAGGPQIPSGMRRNIEDCISYDEASREKIANTQLIRFFPK